MLFKPTEIPGAYRIEIEPRSDALGGVDPLGSNLGCAV